MVVLGETRMAEVAGIVMGRVVAVVMVAVVVEGTAEEVELEAAEAEAEEVMVEAAKQTDERRPTLRLAMTTTTEHRFYDDR